ncbi:MAG: hypothetical protein J6Z43_08665 [Clostridiales bacterium]|nr:hypothetical protein [Clostridiales bacterium]
MGYALFKITQLKESFRVKLNTFVTSLGPAVREGRPISFADNDIGYVLKLQHERIRSKGLDLEYEVYDRDPDSNATVGSEWKDAHYESYVCNEQFGVKRRVTRDGKKVFSDNRKSILYTTVTDVISGVHPDDETVCCPNCGSVSTIAQIQGGCPFCGTVYKMDDLFPKVTGYYFLEDVGIAGNEHKRGMRITMAVTVLALAALVFFAALGRSGIGSALVGALFMIPIGLIAGYFFYSIFLAIRLIVVGSRQSSGKWGTIGSRNKFEIMMRQITPEFSFEYFTSKAVSLIKTAIYAPDEQELLFYKGGPLDPSFKDIIDMDYGAALGLTGFKAENGIVTVATDAFFDVLYASDSGVKFKREKYKAVFQRRTDIPVNMQFSMTKIQCPSCGGSFNAVQNKLCPFCGNAYDITSQDWVLIELRR